MFRLGFDVGSNSVGSSWIDTHTGTLTAGTSVFPAGVDETDDKRGEPKNAKRRMTRRTRITLARRSARKRDLRLKLIAEGLLPPNEQEFRKLLETTDPWALRVSGLDRPLRPYEFGRVLLHLAQRRGALGLTIGDAGEDDDSEDGKVKKAIGAVRLKMLERKSRTFGEFIASLRRDRVTPILTPDTRKPKRRLGVREYRAAVRNKAASYEHCADRQMIRDEFAKLWDAQKSLGSDLSKTLTDDLRAVLDDDTGDAVWRHRGLLFGQRRQSWDVGTLGRCVLEPTERCCPHADMHASRYLVVETVNNLRVIERGQLPRPLSQEERVKIKNYLSGPLGISKARKGGDSKPKTTVTVTDLRILMGWGKASKTTTHRFNIENDEDRTINTDWFSREIIHGAISPEQWVALPPRVQEGVNRAILCFSPDIEGHAEKLLAGLCDWASLTAEQAKAVVTAWRTRPKLDSKRLAMSRKAVKNILAVMDRDAPWPDGSREGASRWLTAIEARKLIAADAAFLDQTSGRPLDEATRRRYATGAKGVSARDRHYMAKHVLLKDGRPVLGNDGKPLSEPPPAPMISNPVVRKAIHEVRRHLMAYMKAFGRKPDEVYLELSREARMGKKDADRTLARNRLRNRIRNDIVESFHLEALTTTQQRAAVTRVVLAVQQRGVCSLCGNTLDSKTITPRMAAQGESCEVAHIIPRACGGHDGFGNVVLAHTKCNRDMNRRTPRDFWEATVKGGYEAGVAWVESIYNDIDRPKLSEVRSAEGDALWLCYFERREDRAKIEQFKKNVTDIQHMTARQDAATKYATRQLMAYLADALYGGDGLPERGGTRRIYATDGLWTSRLRREWGLLFDPHRSREKGLKEPEKHTRQEKNRGDHRHHAIDAIVIGFCTRDVQLMWEKRDREAAAALANSADEEAMETYRRSNPLPPPIPYRSREEFRDAVREAVYGREETEKPVCHRPVKRKLIGALHEETLFGPVLSSNGVPTGLYTSKKPINTITAKHLRMPRPESTEEALTRLIARRQREAGASVTEARKWARAVVNSTGYRPLIVDPPPEKSGLVRDLGLRKQIRRCLEDAGLNPDDFKASDMKKLVEAGGISQRSGVPIRSVVLLRTMRDPVLVPRRRQDYATGTATPDPSPASCRAYVGGNNHHIEIRQDHKGRLSASIVTAFEASQRKLAKLRAFRAAGIPKPEEFRKLTRPDRRRLSPIIRGIEEAHPIIDRSDDESKGGSFVMSLSEGETLMIREKMKGGEIGDIGYFVVAKLDKPSTVVLVPHWDARAATERKDSNGNSVPDSSRQQFSIVPSDLAVLAPDETGIAAKVLVSPLGEITRLVKD